MRFLPLFAAIFAITPLAIDLYLPAMPQLAIALDSQIKVIQNTLSIYLGGYALGMFLFGPLADRFGRRPLIIFGLSGFVVFSGLLSITENIQTFLVFRFLQAFCGGAATVVIPGAIRHLFGKDTAKGLSYVSMIMMVAPMLAPAIGSYLLLLGDWRLIFIMLTAYASLILMFAWRYFPRLEGANFVTEQKLSFVASYQKVLGEKAILAYLAVSVLASMVFFTYLTSVSFLYITVFGFSAALFSLTFGLNVIGLMLANFVNTRLVPKLGSAAILSRAAIIVVLLAATLLGLTVNQYAAVFIVISLILILGVIAVIISNADSLILQQFSTQTGTATAVIGSLRFASGAFAGPLLSYYFDGSATPFALIIFVLVSLLVIFCVIANSQRKHHLPMR